MSQDVDIDALLSNEGFDLARSPDSGPGGAGGRRAHPRREVADELGQGGARPRPARRALYRHCATPACAGRPPARDGHRCRTAHRTRCSSCGGSDNRRAEEALVSACRRVGVRRLVIVGRIAVGSGGASRSLAGRLELRLVDGTERRTLAQARLDLEWADLVLLWGGSELDHRVSSLYTGAAAPRSAASWSTPRSGASLRCSRPRSCTCPAWLSGAAGHSSVPARVAVAAASRLAPVRGA